MSWDGMLPRQNCWRCNEVLNADGNHPAELYAGTFTGLCYRCEREAPRVVKTYHDGAVRISYLPHCPAWRRDREEFIAYPDCPECGGKGRHWVRRPSNKGGSYPVQCHVCLTRFHDDPHRRWATGRDLTIRCCAQRVYEQTLHRAGLARNRAPRRRVEALRAPIVAKRMQMLEQHAVLCQQRGYF